jgi:hypothetical protein
MTIADGQMPVIADWKRAKPIKAVSQIQLEWCQWERARLIKIIAPAINRTIASVFIFFGGLWGEQKSSEQPKRVLISD